MGRFDHLNSQNGVEQRQQRLELANSIDEEDRSDVREWIDQALTPGTEVREVVYRILGCDIEGDVIACLAAFRPQGAFSQRLSSRALRKLWRSLRGVYAFSAARAVARELARQPEEGVWWRLWLWKDLVMPRLAVAVLIGFLLLAGNSGLTEILWRTQARPAWVLAIVVSSVVCTFSLALAEVQRRVSRHVRWMLKGSAILTLYAAGWATVGGLIEYLAAHALAFPMTCGFVVASSATALAAGFLAQLFWEDRSIAEPM